MTASVAVVLASAWLTVGPVTRLVQPSPVAAAGSFADPFFRESTIFSGLTNPTTVRFAADGRAFVAEKVGRVKAFDSIADTTPTTVIDIRTDTNSYWDRGLLGLAVDPGFLAGRPYLYLFYVYDAPPGATAPLWNDTCPNPPGSTADGCVVTSRLERVAVDPATNVADPSSRLVLINDWCQQFPSHSGGGIAFGPDGLLYLSAGEGASFIVTDYGQKGGTLPTPEDPVTPVNPCGDPVTVTSPPGATPVVDVATAEGGSLRSQDLRGAGDPVGLDGSLIRIDPDTGAGAPDNPLAGSSSANARRIVAHGLRNPFRLTFRPGTGQIYLGDVGNFTWEEVERIVVPASPRTATTMPNYGWPCYEGTPKSDWTTLGNDLCDGLYAAGSSAVTGPIYAYSHVDWLAPTGPCFAPDVNGRMGAAISGLAFYSGAEPGTEPYPDRYAGALFFADYSRNCLGVMLAGAGGAPDATKVEQVAIGIGHPVDLLTGPGGDLYYVDHDGGRVVRVRYLERPVARATATPDEALAPVTVHLDGSASSDPDAASSIKAWRWDLDHDGTFDGPGDAAGETFDWSITTPGVYPVTLQVESTNTLTDTDEVVIDATNDPPVPSIDVPSASLTWAVGDEIAFAGHADDAQDGELAAADLSWDLVMLHCPADCHEHLIESFAGVASGSFVAPDHAYPSHLELRLFATDSHGSRRTTSVALQPETTTLDVASAPTGVSITVAGEARTSPSTTTVILGGTTSVSPPLTTSIGGARHRFSTWDDTRQRVRDVTADGPVALTARYVPDAPDACSSAVASVKGSWIAERASGNGDADWFRFTLGSRRRVVVTLGDLPVNGRLELYGACGSRIASSDAGGRHFEEITRVLGAGTYRVRVTAPGDGWSASPYVLRFRALDRGLPVKSSRKTTGGGQTRIVGEVVNNTGSTVGPITVTATFRDGGDDVVARLSTRAFARRLGDGKVTPFAIAGATPAYASVSLRTTAGSPPRVPSLTLRSLTATANPDGTVTERGKVKNTGGSTATAVSVARTWYGTRGQVLERGVATVSPSRLDPGESGTFIVVRPVLAGVNGTRTALRAS